MTDKPAVFSPEDLRKNFERLQIDLTVVQSELDQALGVWRAILNADKQEFKKLLEDREKAWTREETAWETDRQAYDKKIKDLEAFFSTQLAATEKSAVRALNELDMAWQQERGRWQQTLAQQVKEARQTEELQNASKQQLEQRLLQMSDVNVQMQASIADGQARQAETHSTYSGQEQQWQEYTSSLESQIAHFQEEKASWQQTLSDRLQEQQQKEAQIQSLQQQLIEREARLRDSTDAQQAQDQQMEKYVASLEKQIASLQEFIQQVIPSHPMRRKSDSTLGPQSGPHAGPAGQPAGQAGAATWFPRAGR